MRGGGLDRQKKKKIPNLQLFPNLEGGGGLERLGWFPKFNRLLVLMASLSLLLLLTCYGVYILDTRYVGLVWSAQVLVLH